MSRSWLLSCGAMTDVVLLQTVHKVLRREQSEGRDQRPGHQCNQEQEQSEHAALTLSIFHLKNLGPLSTEHLTALYNDSLRSFRLPSIWKTSLVIPIPKPGKDSSQGTSYRPISLLCPAAKVLEALILPSINEFLSPAKDQHGFGPRHSTTSSLLQLTTDIETGFNQRKPPHRTMCVAIDLTAAFVIQCGLSDRPCRPPSLDGCPAT